jgi:hypothetical protein
MKDVVGSFNGKKKLVGDFVYLLIGGLSRKHYGNEELERGFVVEFRIEFRKKRGNVGEELVIGVASSVH